MDEGVSSAACQMEAEDEDDDAMGVETEAALAGYCTDCKDQVYICVCVRTCI